MENTVVDVAPLIEIILEYVMVFGAALVSVLVAWLSATLKKKFNLEIEAKHREAVEQALEKAVQFGVNKVKDVAKDHSKVNVKNAILASAFTYAAASVPAALTAFKVDINTPAGAQRLQDLIEARLEDWVLPKDKDDVEAEKAEDAKSDA